MLLITGIGTAWADTVSARLVFAGPLTYAEQSTGVSHTFQSLDPFAVRQWSPIVLGRWAQSSEDSAQQMRDKYEQTLERIDAALKAWQTNRSIVPGFDQSQDLILQSRGKAVQAYLDVDYGEAIRLAEQALAEVESVRQLEQEYFDLNLNLAKLAYDSEDFNGATDAIILALALRPEHVEAQSLQERIEQLPELISARRDATDAHHAGRLQDEINALYRVLQFRPDEGETLNRIATAKQQLQDRNFNRLISQGHQALTKGSLPEARQALNKAEKLKPQHGESKRLSQKIELIERNNKVSELVAAAEQAAAEDDWHSMQQKLKEVLQLQPELNEAVQGYELASMIIAAQRILDDFVARPHRLSSSNIAAAARQQINRVQPLLEVSPHLRSTVEALESELVKWQQPVPVRVLSDGETHIKVRGVGIIGTTIDRVVMLRPGTYQFEGMRAGFRNKIIEVKVSADAEVSTEVEIMCDEPA